jgi:two-component system chemotaxis sensor kinase CheA
MQWFNNLSIKYKVSLISLIGILGFLTFQLVNYQLSLFTTKQMGEIEHVDFPMLRITNENQIHFMDMIRNYEAAVAEGDLDTLALAESYGTKIRRETRKIAQLSPHLEPEVDQLLLSFDQYANAVHVNAMRLITQTEGVDTLSDDGLFESLEQVRKLRHQFDLEQRQFREDLHTAFANKLVHIQQQSETTVDKGLYLGAILIISLAIVSITIIRQVTLVLGNAVNIAQQVASGDWTAEISSPYKDEAGRLIRALKIMRDTLKSQKEKDSMREINQQRLVKLNETMRGDKTLEELGSSVLGYLAPTFNALAATFWIFDPEQGDLLRVASYASEEDELGGVRCSLGVGLIGQCALDAKIYNTDNLPENYLQISSGVGRASAKSLLVVPFSHDGQVKGVLELASFEPFSENDLTFLSRYSGGIAVAISSSQARLQMSEILAQTQLQALELADQREALVDKSQQLEQSGKYKSQFLSTMSHELRTPLNSILILSKGFLENKSGALSDKHKEHAKVIYSAGSDLLTLINDILDLSKVEEGKLELVVDAIDTREFGNIIFHQFDYEAETKGLEFDVQVEPDVPERFYADRHRLNQILRNFLSNAFKFTSQGGVHLRIERPNGGFVSQRHDLAVHETLVFKVVDSGIGISKEKQQLVFEAFQQADGTTSRKYGGTGLGLTISRELASVMGGEIIIHSEGEGTGCTFALVLPLGSAADVAIEQEVAHQNVKPLALLSRREPVNTDLLKADMQSGECHKQILIVEDDPIQLSHIQSLFDSPVIRLHCATTGLEAKRILQTQKIDCLILDLHLPDGNGLDLLKEIRGLEKASLTGDNEGQHLATVIYTAQSISRDVESTLRQYADRIILKTERSSNWLLSEVCQLLEMENAEVLEGRVYSLNEHSSSGFRAAKDLSLKDDKVLTPVACHVGSDIGSDTNSRTGDLGSADFTFDDSALEGLRVLLVDDDIRNIYSLSATLEDYGMDVLTAGNGQEALDILLQASEQQQVDLVLMDIMMPVMDGYEAMKSIRANPAISQLPILALTAKAMPEDRQRCLDAGANEYLPKPVDIDKLLILLAQQLFNTVQASSGRVS